MRKTIEVTLCDGCLERIEPHHHLETEEGPIISMSPIRFRGMDLCKSCEHIVARLEKKQYIKFPGTHERR